jgi:hypothetical protein
MSSFGNQNVDGDVARSSSRQIDMEEQYRLMALESVISQYLGQNEG